MAQGRPYQAYQKTSVQTSNQKQLIVMLYDGMNRFMDRGVKAIQEGDLEVAHINLHKTGKILLELTSTLREDRGGEVATNLKRLYVYSYEQVVIANLKKDIHKIREVQKVLNNLREGWKVVKSAGAARPMQRMANAGARFTG
ncbi:MAG: flagellar export chaperone FliS [SAR324 cluster bacterium]|uniref:Flagellar secretion chaperone FliS n=1 Tax=SAR324 cluster bacterium TaxID=2024889 RepID=A0A2A4SNW4_9DELT|nr:MAG: flagellar export chaperone FliS [SAR324 cluster bacterium]